MTELSKLYYLNLGKDGTFQPSKNPKYDTTPQDVDQIIEDLRKNNQRKILLYFHGGLVSDKSGMETAERIYRYTKKTGVHPITFVWETGIISTIMDNLKTIDSSRFFKKLLVKIIKISGKQLGINLDDSDLGGKGIGKMSDTQIEQQLQKEHPFEEVSVDPGGKSALFDLGDENITDAYLNTAVQNELSVEFEDEIGEDYELIALAKAPKPEPEAKLMSDQSSSENEVEGQKGIVSAAYLIKCAVRITLKVIKRYLKKRNHGFYPTIVEEVLREFYIADLGEWVWSGMKLKAENMWKLDAIGTPDRKKHGGSYLLLRLKEYQEELKEPLTIDLVGHSAGSIAICNLMNFVKTQHLNFHFRNIIFMAPACTSALFNSNILSNQNLFDNIRIFTMEDKFETKDMLVPFIYPRSLLYFVSGLLEKEEYDAPILGLQRHHSNKLPYDKMEILLEISQYLKEEKRMVYSRTDENALPGFRASSLKHGNFDNDNELTLDSIVSIIKN